MLVKWWKYNIKWLEDLVYFVEFMDFWIFWCKMRIFLLGLYKFWFFISFLRFWERILIILKLLWVLFLCFLWFVVLLLEVCSLSDFIMWCILGSMNLVYIFFLLIKVDDNFFSFMISFLVFLWWVLKLVYKLVFIIKYFWVSNFFVLLLVMYLM